MLQVSWWRNALRLNRTDRLTIDPWKSLDLIRRGLRYVWKLFYEISRPSISSGNRVKRDAHRPVIFSHYTFCRPSLVASNVDEPRSLAFILRQKWTKQFFVKMTINIRKKNIYTRIKKNSFSKIQIRKNSKRNSLISRSIPRGVFKYSRPSTETFPKFGGSWKVS